MTENEKYVMVRLCANLLVHTQLYYMDSEVRLLIDWCIVSNQCKVNNNRIREIMKEVKWAREVV